MRASLTTFLLATTLLAPLHAKPAPHRDDAAAIDRIMDEGFNHSRIMVTAQWLDDHIGSRMTGSPGMRAAEAWTQQKYREWGLTNVHAEGYDFGRGWTIEAVSVRMIEPRVLPLRAIPIAWTPATAGPVTAQIVVAPVKREADLAAWRGKLAGKIVLVDLPGTGSEPAKPAFRRYTGEEIAKLDTFEQPDHGPEALPKWMKSVRLQATIDAFLKAEGAVARVRESYSDGYLLHGEGYQFAEGTSLPGIELAAEDYRRLARLAKTGNVTVEIDSRTHFHDGDRKAYNIIADIPGSDPAAGYVMAGAHLDSWAAADGAADNGAGTAMIMEAARILSATGVRPRRTIRFALWSGEEQGLLGSKAYVEQHIAARPPAPAGTTGLEDYYFAFRRYPVTKLADYDKLAAYFNIDNGSGKLRGVYAQGNLAAVPALNDMIAPFRALGVEKVVAGNTGGTDHEFFAAVGLPAFQYIQDPLDYGSRVHHSSIDTYDHLKADDMRQGAVVLAGMLLEAANRDQPLPRQTLPTKPEPNDPFAYKDPDEDR
ncbi:M20/M25/M40 family metallo-hydrolase [Sphingomonas crusticola]|uniref:M20/M25/M40 family metallo-hydrolase n=1 Tax=Sphingomonas crusticola TaxID=1697973 RepID=UPI000E23530C|nr:M20/M25/M40 family metallo-hydrolase [Sphingomonas crusticola]